MKKKTKKMVAVLLTATMSVSMLAGTVLAEDVEGLASLPGSEEMNGLTLPLTEEQGELSILMAFNSATVSNPNEVESVKVMEERTGVHVDFITAGTTEMMEKYSTVLASGNYPDIIFAGGTNTYPGGIQKGIEDGVILDMDELIREYMPNYMALLSQNDMAWKGAQSDDRKMHYLRCIFGNDTTIQTGNAAYGLTYRADILESMGMDVPTTIDEWHEVLKACKENGMEAPFALESDGGSALSLAWGVNTDWAGSYWQTDGTKMIYAPILDGFGDYLETMRQWYAEGLIDPNFTNGNMVISQDYTNIQNNQTMLFSIWFGFMNGSWMDETGAVDVPGINMQAVGVPKLNESDAPIKCIEDCTVNYEIFITTSCEDPVLAAKWLDYQFSKEGAILNWYGIEDVTYTLDSEGIPQYTEMILNNEDGLTPSQVLQKYALNASTELGYINHAAQNKVAAALSSTGTTPQIESAAIWNDPEAKTIAVPLSLSLTREEGEEVNRYMTDIKTLTQEYMVNYIIGVDDTPYEEFREKLYEYGMQTVLDIYQAAYERYLAR